MISPQGGGNIFKWYYIKIYNFWINKKEVKSKFLKYFYCTITKGNSGGFLDMSYLYITEDGAKININGGYFIVECENVILCKIPKETLESVALFGNVKITTPCLQEFLKRNISVSFFSKVGNYFGKLESTRDKDILKLKNQIYRCDDNNFSLEISKKIVDAKINNQITILKRYSKNNTENIDLEIKNMKNMRSKISTATNVEKLIGYEGTAAKEYFLGISKIIKAEFAFKGRNKRPPKDPFNSLISLGYTLLTHEISGEIENKGLTPYSGFLHKDHKFHPALASDLIEEWRAIIVDCVALSLIQGNEIHIDNFVKDEKKGSIFLTKDGMKIFLKKYENRLNRENSYLGKKMSFRQCIWYQVNELVKAINMNCAELYKPVLIR